MLTKGGIYGLVPRYFLESMSFVTSLYQLVALICLFFDSFKSEENTLKYNIYILYHVYSEIERIVMQENIFVLVWYSLLIGLPPLIKKRGLKIFL